MATGTSEKQERRCPLTKGQPTGMTEKSFKICCEQQKSLAREHMEQDEGMVTKRVFFTPSCIACSGPPPELTIIDLPQSGMHRESTMNAKPNENTGKCCELCGRPSALRKSHGKMACQMCLVVRNVANKRPAVLLESLREFAPDLLGGVAWSLKVQGRIRLELQDMKMWQMGIIAIQKSRRLAGISSRGFARVR